MRILGLILGFQLLIAFLPAGLNAQPVRVATGSLPVSFYDEPKHIPIVRDGDSLWILVVRDTLTLHDYLRVRDGSWNRESSIWARDPWRMEFRVSRGGLPYHYSRDTLRYIAPDSYEQISRYCPGRPVLDSLDNFHLLWPARSDALIYSYSSDTLNSYAVWETLAVDDHFVFLVSSPTNSTIAALFMSEGNDSLYKYMAPAGQPIDFSAPSQVVPCDVRIASSYDITIDREGEVFFVVTMGYSWGSHYIWSETQGFRFLDESVDDVVQGTNFQITFGPSEDQILVIESENPPCGRGSWFFATTDGGETWYGSAFRLPQAHYGSAPRIYGDSLDFTYFTTYPNTSVYHYGIPTDSIFDNLTDLKAHPIKPAVISLSSYPNPFNSQTRIVFELPYTAYASLQIYDILGNLVATLFEGPLPSGPHDLIWDGRDAAGHPMSSGLYFCRLQTPDADRSLRMILLK